MFVRSEDDDVDATGIPTIETNCVSVSEFGKYAEEHHSNSNRGFRDQFFVSLLAINSTFQQLKGLLPSLAGLN